MPLALLRRLAGPPTETAAPRTEILPPLQAPDGTSIPIVLRRPPRATRLSLRIAAHAEAVALIVPPGLARAKAIGFLQSRRDWIIRQWQARPAPIRFVPGTIVPVLGIDRVLVALGTGRGRTPPFRLTDTTIDVTGDPAHLARRTQSGLAALARPMLAAKAAALARRLGRPLGRISVGDPKARWGSCSGTGNLRFSWRLILMPEPVMDYVVAHEVAHLAEMNHGADFWRLVETLAPGHAAERAWLSRNGARILRYGG